MIEVSSVSYFIWMCCYLVVQAGLVLYGLHRYTIIFLFLKHRKRVPKPPGEFAELPRVTVQLPVFNELYVVQRLIRAVGGLDYPKDRLQIQVLDDSTDETTGIARAEVERLRRAGLDAELIHREDRVGFKAGALEEGLRTATGEFLLILDADFVAPPELLRKTIHHFTDPKVGMVQTRWGHLNANYSLLTQVQSVYIDAHFVLEHVARCQSGRFFNFNGTGGILRRECITSSGGWQHDTLTEDLDLSYRAQLNGWKFIYVNDVVTPAELPVEMNGFKSQQHRWAKGSVQTCIKLLPAIWRSKLPLLVKIEGTAHLSLHFVWLFIVMLAVLLFPTLNSEHGLARAVFVDMPLFAMCSLPAVLFYFCAQKLLYPGRWFRRLLLLPALLAVGVGVSLNNSRAVLEGLLGHRSGFVRTPKYGIESKWQDWRRRRYSPLKSLLAVAEIAFAAYFTWLLAYGIRQELYLVLPFLLLFQLGFMYVAGCSVAQWLPPPAPPSSDSSEDVVTA